MERKIGEIFEFSGEWYQCVKSNGTCNGCAGKFQPYSFCNGFKECVGKIFKKLEKVGEPYSCNYYGDNRLIMMQEYNLFNLDDVTNEDKIPMYITDYKHKRIAIEIKQNKEDMEEKKLNLKPFDLEAAKSGKPVCTRDGRKARIICFDLNTCSHYSVIAAITNDSGCEEVTAYMENGSYLSQNEESSRDLMMLPEKKEGWILLRKDGCVFDNEQVAKKNCTNDYFVAKVEWEE